MGQKEKRRKIYQKNYIRIREEDIEMILKDTEKTVSFMILYKQEKMEIMNKNTRVHCKNILIMKIKYLMLQFTTVAKIEIW